MSQFEHIFTECVSPSTELVSFPLAFCFGFAGEMAKIRFHFSNIGAGDITLCRAQLVAHHLRVEVAFSTMYGIVAAW